MSSYSALCQNGQKETGIQIDYKTLFITSVSVDDKLRELKLINEEIEKRKKKLDSLKIDLQKLRRKKIFIW